MERKLKEVKLDSAKTFSELYGLKDQSPLIGVIDFKTAQKSPNNLEMEYGVYRQLPAFFYSLPRGSLKTATVA